MKINTNSQLVCVNSALILIFFMIISFVVIAGWMPPLSPALNADQVAEIFRTDTNRIRLAGFVMTIGAVFLWPFGVAISEQMKRIEGQLHHPLTNLQLATVTLTVGAIFLAGMLWMLCAYQTMRTHMTPSVFLYWRYSTRCYTSFSHRLLRANRPPKNTRHASLVWILQSMDRHRIFSRRRCFLFQNRPLCMEWFGCILDGRIFLLWLDNRDVVCG